MIRFGLRLTIAGGREAISRLIIIAAAVALGVGLLLSVVASAHAVSKQSARYVWLNTSDGGAPTADPLWWLLREDYFDGQSIGRIDIAATGPESPVPPGIPALPGPGQYYASPAMSKLLAATPADELRDRYPGQQIGTIGDAALPSPDILLIIVGRTPTEMSQLPRAHQVNSIASPTAGGCADCYIGVRAAGLQLVLSVVAGALLFPLLIFIGTATRLSATRREERFAAMRLIGATPRQVSVISTVESTVAALAGTLVGFGLYFALHPGLAQIPFTGTRFFSSDLSLNPLDVVLVVLGVPVAAALAARLSLRRVRISPLGVTRRVTPRPPRAYRLIPLALGLAELTYFIGRRPETSLRQVAAFLPGFLIVMAGLVIAGPWLTMVGARLLARRSRRPATLIAARRLADNPKAGFRAVSGLMLALFVTSVAIGVITTIVDNRGPRRDSTSASTMTIEFWPDDPDTTPATSVPAGTEGRLHATPGVKDLTLVRVNPDDGYRNSGQEVLPGVISCTELARLGSFGRCPDGTQVAMVWWDLVGPLATYGGTWRGEGTVWRAAPLTAAQLDQLPILSVLVVTDGTTATIERVRTIMELAYPQSANPPATADDFNLDSTKNLVGWQRLADVIILASLPIAGCSLAVSVAGGLSERRRPFSLLRLTGVPLRMLRRVVGLESAVPLLVVAVVAIGTGFLSAQIFLKAQLQYTLSPPPVSYFIIVVAGLVASLGIIAGTLPLLRRITGPEAARND